MKPDQLRRRIRRLVAEALDDYQPPAPEPPRQTQPGQMTTGEGELAPPFVHWLTTRCVLAKLSPQEIDALRMDCTIYTPEQIEQLTGKWPAENDDRHLTDAELALALHWSERTTKRRLAHAYARLENGLPAEWLSNFGPPAIDLPVKT